MYVRVRSKGICYELQTVLLNSERVMRQQKYFTEQVPLDEWQQVMRQTLELNRLWDIEIDATGDMTDKRPQRRWTERRCDVAK